MTDTRQRAAELVAEAFATEQDYFTMDDLLEDFEMPDFEPDARLRAEKASDAINFHFNDDSERRGMISLSPQGLEEAMTVMFDERLQAMTAAVVDQHRQHESNDTAQPAFDYRVGYDNTELPVWDRHDPKQANVIRGLVASDPSRLYVLRGKFGASDLLRMVYDDGVESACGLNYSPECDPMATPPSGGERWQRRWAVFPVPHGEYLVYFTICAECYFDFWHKNESGTGFVSFDPKHDAVQLALNSSGSHPVDNRNWKGIDRADPRPDKPHLMAIVGLRNGHRHSTRPFYARFQEMQTPTHENDPDPARQPDRDLQPQHCTHQKKVTPW